MNVVGVDLAWSATGKGWTGLCAVVDGAVVASGTAKGDDEIVEWVQPWLDHGALVAVDAPVLVTNAVGRRLCEARVSSVFGAYHAGCHPSNLGRFPDGTRALRLARRLGLDIDPWIGSGGGRGRCIEVYPHPALVALFGLSHTLKYKAKKGRSIATRQAEFTRLIACLVSLRSADPPLAVASAPRWPMLARLATRSPTSAELDRVEDELDAFVCAYIGLYHWTHGAPRSAVVGDLTDGYIVLPVAGAGHASALHPAAAVL